MRKIEALQDCKVACCINKLLYYFNTMTIFFFNNHAEYSHVSRLTSLNGFRMEWNGIPFVTFYFYTHEGKAI